jgi:flagellar biosynthesis chaperone FliJ
MSPWSGVEYNQMKVEDRLTRLEGIVEKLADNQLRLDETLETLAEAQIKLVEHNTLREKQDALRAKQDALRAKQIDERIDRLVSAMGEFIRRTG